MVLADGLKLHEVADLLTLAGRLLLGAGAEIFRVEETLTRMGHACGVESVDVLCTPTGITYTLVHDTETLTRVVATRIRGLHLATVVDVNAISRGLEAGELSPQRAAQALERLKSRPRQYPVVVAGAARGLSSACWALLLGGTWADFVPALLTAFPVHFVHDRTARLMPEFLAIFLASLVGTAAAMAMAAMSPALHRGALVIGVIIPLVPGTALTGAVRNLIAGDLVSGVTVAADALLQAAAIAAGVACTLAIVRGQL